jgi:methionyl-tRNA formyltransferase
MVLRAGFMGSPAFAVPSLRAVARTCDLRVVVCQPDRPAGRGLELAPPAVKLAAAEYDVPILQPVKMKDGTLAAALREHALDVVIVTAFGRILPPDILALPRHGCINVHASVLPRWRGAAPIQRAILAGDRETGVSIMQMDEGLDTGAVFTTVTTPIGPSETSGELFERLAELGGDALATFLSAFPDVAPPQQQDHDAATHAPRTSSITSAAWIRGPARSRRAAVRRSSCSARACTRTPDHTSPAPCSRTTTAASWSHVSDPPSRWPRCSPRASAACRPLPTPPASPSQ